MPDLGAFVPARFPADRSHETPTRARSANRRALLILALAVALLATFGTVAALPAVQGSFRIVLAALGYVSFVGLFGAAMRRWKTDWEALSFDPNVRSRGCRSADVLSAFDLAIRNRSLNLR